MSKKNKKNSAVKPEGRVKHFLKTNYWLTPLLLVALVFALVFGISKIPALSDTIKGWFNKHEECKECTAMTFEEFEKKVETEEGTFYVVFGQKDCSGCDDLYPVLDKYLKTANKNGANITIYFVDLSMEDEDKFTDSTLTMDKLDKLKQTYKDNGKLGYGFELESPSIIKYENKEIAKGIKGSLNYDGVKDFFEEN